MDESYHSLLAAGVEKRLRDLEASIMADVIRRIKKTGTITSTADWQIQRLVILGSSAEDIRKMISKAVDGNEERVRELYDEVIAREYTGMKDIYEESGKDFIPYEQNPELQQEVNAMVQQSSDELKNITKNTGFMLDMGGRKVYTSLSDVYNGYLDDAITGMVSGAYDYNTMIKQVVNQMTASGLRTVDYASGAHNRVDVAARRALLTGFGQIAGKVTDLNAQKLNTSFFEVTWHAASRPSHAEWQGKVYSKEELRSVCGLGEGGGLLGWNCRHTYYPFIPGISERQYTDEWLEQKNAEEAQETEFRGRSYNAYDATQKQRQLETTLRAYRERVQLMRQGGVDQESITLTQCKYQAVLDEYHEFSRKMKLPEQTERIYTGRTTGRIAPSKQTYAKWQAEQINKAKERAESRKDMDTENTQRYKPITRGEAGEFTYSNAVNVSARRVSTYEGNIFVADNAHIKPKALHQINKNTESAMREYNIPMERKPTMVIANAQDILSYGKYDAVNNTVFYASDITDKVAMQENGGLGSTERHEMWHLKQAENYRKDGKNITEDNYDDYIANACRNAKINLDRLGITEYNVDEISDYAKKNWLYGRYDEVEAEYMRKHSR